MHNILYYSCNQQNFVQCSGQSFMTSPWLCRSLWALCYAVTHKLLPGPTYKKKSSLKYMSHVPLPTCRFRTCPLNWCLTWSLWQLRCKHNPHCISPFLWFTHLIVAYHNIPHKINDPIITAKCLTVWAQNVAVVIYTLCDSHPSLSVHDYKVW